MNDRELLEAAAEDDGAALRLAVRRRMRVNVSATRTEVVYYTELGAASVEELSGSDPCEATRRAIVRAAAAMVTP